MVRFPSYMIGDGDVVARVLTPAGETAMKSYRTNFDLELLDVDLIEQSLSARVSELSRAITEAGDADKNSHKAQLEEVRDLLGRIHNQKIWCRPEEFVPQG